MSSVGGAGDIAGTRSKGVCVIKPIVYGNWSRHFGKKRESDGHTHDWSVYVKLYENEDMSSFVKKVQFKLHESYPNPNRIVYKPPYEVSETGWGEFEVAIKIFFSDVNERPVTLYHVLKLFHTPADKTTQTLTLQGKKTVVSENYDEIIFQDPTQYIHTFLTNTRSITNEAYKHETDFEERRERTLEACRAGRARAKEEISEFKDRLKLAQETIGKFKAEIAKVQLHEHQRGGDSEAAAVATSFYSP